MPGPELVRLQGFLRSVAGSGRESVRRGPFVAYFDRADPLKYLNYAIPDDGAEPDAAEIAALRAAFHERERLPRLEWVGEVAPAVAGALAGAGMTEELETPLMTCTEAELGDARPAVDGLEVGPARDDDLRALTNVQRVAFGQPPHADDEPADDPRSRGNGIAVALVDGEVVGVAVHTRVSDGISEVAGVAIAEAWRRRGIAGAVTAAAARMAFEAGAELCVLSPGGETAMRVYARAGFRRAATMLHWSDGA